MNPHTTSSREIDSQTRHLAAVLGYAVGLAVLAMVYTVAVIADWSPTGRFTVGTAMVAVAVLAFRRLVWALSPRRVVGGAGGVVAGGVVVVPSRRLMAWVNRRQGVTVWSPDAVLER